MFLYANFTRICLQIHLICVYLIFEFVCIWWFFQHEKEYREIIAAVKGTEKEKRLASQFIGKFFKHFPNLADLAIDASLDLCEDENIQIRRQAIKDLPLLCKDTKDHIPKIGDILAQLLVVDDQLELQQVHMSLQQILKFDAKAALAGVVSSNSFILLHLLNRFQLIFKKKIICSSLKF